MEKKILRVLATPRPQFARVLFPSSENQPRQQNLPEAPLTHTTWTQTDPLPNAQGLSPRSVANSMRDEIRILTEELAAQSSLISHIRGATSATLNSQSCVESLLQQPLQQRQVVTSTISEQQVVTFAAPQMPQARVAVSAVPSRATQQQQVVASRSPQQHVVVSAEPQPQLGSQQRGQQQVQVVSLTPQPRIVSSRVAQHQAVATPSPQQHRSNLHIRNQQQMQIISSTQQPTQQQASTSRVSQNQVVASTLLQQPQYSAANFNFLHNNQEEIQVVSALPQPMQQQLITSSVYRVIADGPINSNGEPIEIHIEQDNDGSGNSGCLEIYAADENIEMSDGNGGNQVPCSVSSSAGQNVAGASMLPEQASSSFAPMAPMSNEEPTTTMNIRMIPIGPNNTCIPEGILNGMPWNSPSLAVRKLLMHLFDRHTLATHSMTGRPSPAFKNADMPIKSQLPELTVNDIVHCVLTHCPTTSEKEVRNAITTKLADENKMMRMKMKRQKDKGNMG